MQPEYLLNDETGQIVHYPSWISDSNFLFTELRDGVNWSERNLTMFGRELTIPRLEAWVGTPGISYTYSGQTYLASGWPNALKSIVESIQKHFSWKANSALLNYYRDGKDSVGWHADDEPELGVNPTIAILSLGASRKLAFKSKLTDGGTFQVLLEAGSLLVMQGETQNCWKHAINKVKNADARISCTFREVKLL